MKARLRKVLVRVVLAIAAVVALQYLYSLVLGWFVDAAESSLGKETCAASDRDAKSAAPPSPAFYRQLARLDSIAALPLAHSRAREVAFHAQLVCSGAFSVQCIQHRIDAVGRATKACAAGIAGDDPRLGGCFDLGSQEKQAAMIRSQNTFSAEDRAFCDTWSELRRYGHTDDTCDLCTLQ